MARKSKQTREMLLKMQEQVKDIEHQLQKAEEDEKAKLEEAERQITTITEANDMFCGVILSHKDIVNLVELAMTTTDSIRIPFKLYFNT